MSAPLTGWRYWWPWFLRAKVRAMRAQAERSVTYHKLLIETITEHHIPIPDLGGRLDMDIAVDNQLSRGRSIEAIKIVMQMTGWGLRESRDYVKARPGYKALNRDA